MSKLPIQSSEYKAAAADLENEVREAEADREYVEKMLAREINWVEYVTTGDLTKKDQGMLLDYDKQSSSDQNDLIQEKGQAYAQLFLKALDKIRAPGTVEYLIILIDQMLSSDRSRAQYFHKAANLGADIYSPFLRILQSGASFNSYILHTSSRILGELFASAPSIAVSNPHLQAYISYLSGRLHSASGRESLRVLAEVKALVSSSSSSSSVQDAFIGADGLKVLSELLHRETQNAQLIYLVGFSLWLLSYNVNSAKPLQELGVIKKLVSIVKANVMEKVVRIAYAIFRNLLEVGDVAIVEELIGHGLVGLTDTLSKRKFKDADLMADMELISRTLQESIQKLSTFEIYQSEVLSGSLKESPVHTNEAFWRENIGQFESNNFKIVQQLVNLARDNNESDEVREVAAWDLGEFARFHPDGRKIVQKLGGKSALMILMTNKNPKLAKAALLATQKIMVNNWEFLQKSSAAGVQSLVATKK